MFCRINLAAANRRTTRYRRRATISHLERLEPRQLMAGLMASGAQALDLQQLPDGDLPAIAEIAERGDRFGEAIAVGDFDRDGIPDMAVGVPGESGRGLVNVIYGRPGAFSAAANHTLDHDAPGADFGYSLASGDFDRDGFDDLAVAAPREDVSRNGTLVEDAGAVYVIHGSRAGLDGSTKSRITPYSHGIGLGDTNRVLFGWDLTVGDLNNDFQDDLVIGAPGDDVNGRIDAGSVVIMMSALSPQVWNQDSSDFAGAIEGGSETGDFFGSSVAVGDFDGNFRDDLAIGVPYEDNERIFPFSDEDDVGAVNVIYNNPTWGLLTQHNRVWWQDSGDIEGDTEPGDLFGFSVATGDFDNDGFDDLATGVPGESLDSASGDNHGAVNVIYGSHARLTDNGNEMWHQDDAGISSPAEHNDQFGHAVATGDFDGDGFDDLFVGSPLEGIDTSTDDDGAVNIIRGSFGGLTNGDDLFLTTNANGMPSDTEDFINLGHALATANFGAANDVLIVGAPKRDVSGGGNNAADAGAVYAVYGGFSNVFDVQTWHQNIVAARGLDGFAEFGQSLAVGDFNNDGRADAVFGAPGKDLPTERRPGDRLFAGIVNVLDGGDGSSGVMVNLDDGKLLYQDLLHNARAAGGSERTDEFGKSFAVGDVNGDGFDDLAVGVPFENLPDNDGDHLLELDAGVVHFYLGSSDGIQPEFGMTFLQGEQDLHGVVEDGDHFGYALAMGDFDDDGFDDLAIGVPGEDMGRTNQGAIHVLYGDASGRPGAQRRALFNQGTSGIGGNETGDQFGFSLAAGDFDGDGADDLAIGAPFENLADISDAGAVGVMYGLAGTGLTSARSVFIAQTIVNPFSVQGDPEADDHFGWSLAVGDFSGDGRDDLAIGVPGEDLATQSAGLQQDAGAVNVVYSTPAGLSPADNELWHQDTGFSSPTEAPGTATANTRFGESLASGDFDSSGEFDLAIGPTDVAVVYSDGNGLDEDAFQQFAVTDLGFAAEDAAGFGAALAAGDLNGDGASELIVGAPHTLVVSHNGARNNLAGRAFVLRGTPGVIFNSRGDYDGDGQLTTADIDMLSAVSAAGSDDPLFDLTFDGKVDRDDVEFWIEDLFGTQPGDANLDFAVDVSDFTAWNAHKFTDNVLWSRGNFNGDEVTDVSDFIIWNAYRFSVPGMLGAIRDGGRKDRLFPHSHETGDPLARRPQIDNAYFLVDAIFGALQNESRHERKVRRVNRSVSRQPALVAVTSAFAATDLAFAEGQR